MDPIDILIKNSKDNDWSFLEELNVKKDVMIKAVKANPKNIQYIFPKLKYEKDVKDLLSGNSDILPYLKDSKTFQKYFPRLSKIVETDYDSQLVNDFILEKKENILFLPSEIKTVENIEKVLQKFGYNHRKDFYSQLKFDQDKLNQLIAEQSLVPIFILKFDLLNDLEFKLDYIKEILKDSDNQQFDIVTTVLFEIYEYCKNNKSKKIVSKLLFGDFIDNFDYLENNQIISDFLDIETQVKIGKRYVKYLGYLNLDEEAVKQIKIEYNVIASMTMYGYVGDSAGKYYDNAPGTLYNLDGLLNRYIDDYDPDYRSEYYGSFENYQNEQCDNFKVKFTKKDIKKVLTQSKLSKEEILEMLD